MWPGWSRQPLIGGGWIGPEQEMRFYWCGGSESDGRTDGRPVRMLDRSIQADLSPHRQGQEVSKWNRYFWVNREKKVWREAIIMRWSNVVCFFIAYCQVVVSFVVLALAQPKNLVCNSCGASIKTILFCWIQQWMVPWEFGKMGTIHEASKPPNIFVKFLFCF